MTDAFRDTFVGEKGYDALKKVMKSGNDFCTDAAKCLQERSDAEINYVKALRKTSDTLQKLAGRAKGSLAQAFATLATQTSSECDAHNLIAGTLLSEISIPLKNLAEAQMKERKSIEDALNKKFKEWNAQKESDNKYRSRQFEQSRDIETLTNKAIDLSTAPKSSSKSKTSSLSTPLVRCVLPAGRHASASEKSTSNIAVKCNSLDSSINKAEEELETIERKYHLSTRNVEYLRQACDTEMIRSSDKMQTMEYDRIKEIANFLRTYATAIQTLTGTMHQVAQDLYAIQVSPENDIIVQARSNVQPAEYEILLYDIYAENEDNVMSEQKRILSLMNWMGLLRKDIEIQQQTKNASLSSLSSASRSQKSNENESPDDDRGSPTDGAMCSFSKKDNVRKSVQQVDGSSSSSNDDDGGMNHSKREKTNKNKSREGFSSEVFIDRRGAVLLEEFYQASLFKIESVYNRLKRLPEPKYEYAQRLTRTFNEKGFPTTFLRLPAYSLTQSQPSAPSATQCFAQAMPMYVQATNIRQPALMTYSTQRQAPPVGFVVNEPQLQCSAPAANAPPRQSTFPLKEIYNNRSAPFGAMFMVQPTPVKYVRALYSYKAKHKDELDLEPGNIIILMDRREDDWFRGNLDGKIGLFPGNYVEEI